MINGILYAIRQELKQDEPRDIMLRCHSGVGSVRFTNYKLLPEKREQHGNRAFTYEWGSDSLADYNQDGSIRVIVALAHVAKVDFIEEPPPTKEGDVDA